MLPIAADSATPVTEAQIEDCVRAALAEDIGSGDLTADLIPAHERCTARVICREAAILAGVPWFDKVFGLLDPATEVSWYHADGDAIEANAYVCDVHGLSRIIVSGERTALNFLQTLSATATATRRCVDALGDSSTRILDTRKTVPGLRVAQKYAVRCGGGVNHRSGLFDGVLIKENHIIAAGSIGAAVAAARGLHGEIPVEVEVESMQELDEALAAGADMILLDNFSRDQIAAALTRVAGRTCVEISGGVDLADLAELGRCNADFISIGALTKHIRAVDFSMRMPPTAG